MVAQGGMHTQSRGVLLGYLQSDDRPQRPKPSVHEHPPGGRAFVNSAPELQLTYRTSKYTCES